MIDPPRADPRRVRSSSSRMTATASGSGTPDAPTSPRGMSSARISLGKVLRPESKNYFLLLGVTLFLVGLGLVMVLSSSSVESYEAGDGYFGLFWRQATFAMIGVPLMLIVSRFPARFWKKWAWVFLLVAMGLQLLVFTPLGYEIGGNRNWIEIGGFTAQPSEAVKLALVVWLGLVLTIKQPRLLEWKHALIPVIPFAGLSIGLVLLGGDLGTVVIMALIVFSALYFAGVRLRYIAIPVVAGAVLFLIMAVTSANRMQRIMAFFGDGKGDYENADWQSTHGTWALANGGLWGVGLGNSRAKYGWLPAISNDFIFAAIGEELGLIGAVLVLGLFVFLAVMFIRVIRTSDDSFVRITTGAIMAWIIGQALVNIGVVLGVLPVLGVPLPLLSSGGTALLTTLVAIGIVLSFARERGRPTPQQSRRSPARRPQSSGVTR
ncbi:putative lipid II flippase FtsW [Plantibacter sp. MCCC 1A11337]|uniref:putative lipid II flippase FtsW n=2 Tax=Plantibacter TaxID=190323 RepID=UPI00099DCB35|nr:putative lipid II flippase FtsW [Plantibacter flavus]AQX80418.1 putative lipid II flippase FtsW [Plantibacter flavus]NUJ86447.1 putative lipid II flippase FtsW [Plantibacter sp. MCCC 1A11337]